MDDTLYKAEGMGTAVKGVEVTVWYDPNAAFYSYAGNRSRKVSCDYRNWGVMWVYCCDVNWCFYDFAV